jgi:hypothetical protein
MASKEGYIGGPTGGVPEKIFVPGFEDYITGASGTPLFCSANWDHVRISETIIFMI